MKGFARRHSVGRKLFNQMKLVVLSSTPQFDIPSHDFPRWLQ